MAEAMQFHLYTLNQMERRQEQMRILDKDIAKGLSQKIPPISPIGMQYSVTLQHFSDPIFTFF